MKTLKLIIKGNTCSHCGDYGCEHSKPHKEAVLELFQVWQERTCGIEEFDKRFGKNEGVWTSKGTSHSEVNCDNDGCHCKGVHCRRKMDDSNFWCLNFTSLKDLETFFKEVGYCKIYEETQDGCSLTIDIT